ncbi:hypothetical protein LTR10_006252 [Elasticomyces elasticus]|nr:hypothetical protein LTR10_006252 [Elasticomyces elasticus]KAK4966698.1 hypothetical protein LTR42_011009 [Elasticomyces elasticus]
MASPGDGNEQSQETDAVGGAVDTRTTRPIPTVNLPDDSTDATNGTTGSTGDDQYAQSNDTQPDQSLTTSASAHSSPVHNGLPYSHAGSALDERHLSASQRLARGIGRVTNTRRLSQSARTRPNVCDKCRQLKLTFESFVVEDDISNASPRRSRFQGKKTMGTYQEIKARYDRTGCELCQLLMKSLDNRPGSSELPATSNNSAKCGLFWRVDGRETVPAESAASAPRLIKRTRRLAIEWVADGAAYEPSYIVLVAPHGTFLADGTVNPQDSRGPQGQQGGSAGKSTFFLGRKLTSLDVANTQLVKNWLELCRQFHPECKIDHASPAFRDLQSQACFMVLDVRGMLLRELPEEAKYVALSYTWGPPDEATALDRFKVTNANVRELEKDDGVRDVLRLLPVAIQNAIALTQHLGFDYIWIDSLCIIQGNNDSWNANARLMDSIYGYAELTICAADGDGANVGLEALYSSDREHQKSYRPGAEQQVIVQYPTHGVDHGFLELMLSWPSETYVACSRWNSRAWTFQERMLSPRCLICVNQRVYFQCKTTTMSEDIYSDDRTEKGAAGWSVELRGAPARTLKRLETEPVNVYKDCLRMYTSRQLSDESDILSAFEGIGKVVCQGLAYLEIDDAEERALLFGLPASHFDFALLWQPKEVPTRRCSEKPLFPSWSWSGWKCASGMSYRRAAVAGPEINLHEWLLKRTWITYYIRDSGGHLRLVWDPKILKQKSEAKDRWKGYDTPDRGWPSSSEVMPTIDLHGRPWNDKMPKRGRLHEKGMGPGPQDKQFDLRLPAFRNKPRNLPPGTKRAKGPDMPYLQFYTWWGKFYVSMEGEDDPLVDALGSTSEPVGAGLKRYAILDRHEDFAGVIVLDEAWAQAHSADEPQEFIAISRAKDFDEGEYGSWGLYVEEDQDGGRPWQLYNVMMIVRDDPNKKEHEDEGVAYRRGLGKMYKQAFEHACAGADGTIAATCEWKEILLG